MTGAPRALAARVQLQQALTEKVGWAEVIVDEIRYDSAAAIYLAGARSVGDPPSNNISCGGSVLVITEKTSRPQPEPPALQFVLAEAAGSGSTKERNAFARVNGKMPIKCLVTCWGRSPGGSRWTKTSPWPKSSTLAEHRWRL